MGYKKTMYPMYPKLGYNLGYKLWYKLGFIGENQSIENMYPKMGYKKTMYPMYPKLGYNLGYKLGCMGEISQQSFRMKIHKT